MTTRRSFLLECLALGAAPAVVRAPSIMPVVVHGWARPRGRYAAFKRDFTAGMVQSVEEGPRLALAPSELVPVYDIVTDALYIRRGGAWHRLPVAGTTP